MSTRTFPDQTGIYVDFTESRYIAERLLPDLRLLDPAAIFHIIIANFMEIYNVGWFDQPYPQKKKKEFMHFACLWPSSPVSFEDYLEVYTLYKMFGKSFVLYRCTYLT